MDVVLEVFDTLYLDKFWAQVLPASESNVYDAMKGAITGSATNETLQSSVASWISNLSIGNRPERYGLVPTYLVPPSEWATKSLLGRENPIRQSLSLLVITTIFGWLLYLGTAAFSYQFVFDKKNLQHPKFLKNQMRLEIQQAMGAIPWMTALTVPWFVAELQGYSKLYWGIEEYGLKYFVLSFPLFLIFSDMGIYIAHRWLHSKWAYKRLHKPHHKWLITTPFASHAFHPVDGYLQSISYHIFPFIFPLQKVAYIALFGFVNIWTVLIHDGEYVANDPVINGSACHTIHHLYFNYNYGQYTTFFDRIGGTHRTPDKELFDKSKKMSKSYEDKQIDQLEGIRREVEGKDDRVYASGSEPSLSATEKR